MRLSRLGSRRGRGGMGIAPFDVIGDFLRGTQGIAIDMFRKPEKLMECIDMIYDIIVPRQIKHDKCFRRLFRDFPFTPRR